MEKSSGMVPPQIELLPAGSKILVDNALDRKLTTFMVRVTDFFLDSVSLEELPSKIVYLGGLALCVGRLPAKPPSVS